jgi:tripartite-type tricarboxylate transporter receptor subunit TctC
MRRRRWRSCGPWGWSRPAGLPEARALAITAAVTAALHAPEALAKLRPMGLEPTGGTPAQLRARIAADRARWAPVIEASGFKADEP